MEDNSYEFQSRRDRVVTVANNLEMQQRMLRTRYSPTFLFLIQLSTLACVASVLVALQELPTKITPLIVALTNSIKEEELVDFQHVAAEGICELVKMCMDRKPSPNDKLLSNICTLACIQYQNANKEQPSITARYTTRISVSHCSEVLRLRYRQSARHLEKIFWINYLNCGQSLWSLYIVPLPI
jgi:hypothetical protein